MLSRGTVQNLFPKHPDWSDTHPNLEHPLKNKIKLAKAFGKVGVSKWVGITEKK